jgi:hypothetical protein
MWLHKFETARQWEDCIEEVCVRCHERVYHKIVDERVDNRNYVSYHAREVLQPNHPLFLHEYPQN